MISAQELRKMVEYNSDTGEMRWVEPKMGRQVNREQIGCQSKDGYGRVMIDGRQYLLHRLVWLYVHGSFPERLIDHIDGDPRNNKLANLREASYSGNNLNSVVRCDNSIGVRGVYYCKAKKKYHVRVSKDKRRFGFGYYQDLELAELVASEARDKLHGPFCRQYF